MSVSTHVLDTALGLPAEGVPVSLERRGDAEWVALSPAGLRTDADGRARQLMAETETMRPGVYRVRFETAAYFKAQRLAGLYPYVEIVFEAREAGGHYHIPLLLTANGYTTYRGS